MTSTEKKAPSKKEESVFDWLKTLPPREGNIFFSLCEDGKKTVNKSKLKEAIFDAGLQINDFRLRSFFKKLDRHRSNDIEFEDFNSIIKAGGLLIEKALRGELGVPDFRDFSMNLDKIYDEIRPNRSGDLAKYIPPLAEVDPEQFGIAVVTTDGQIYQRGDSDVDFSIQSMCKVFNYSIVVENLGLDKVKNKDKFLIFAILYYIIDQSNIADELLKLNETSDPQDGKAAPYGSGFKPINMTRKQIEELVWEVVTEKDDRCTRIAKRKYDTWPSAYASGAVVRCRRGEIWKGQK